MMRGLMMPVCLIGVRKLKPFILDAYGIQVRCVPYSRWPVGYDAGQQRQLHTDELTPLPLARLA